MHYSLGELSCACCGEEELKFLALDHTNSDGPRMGSSRSGGNVFFAWLQREGYPPGLQVLCATTATALKARVGRVPMPLGPKPTPAPLISLSRIAGDLARAWELADLEAPLHPTYGVNGRGIGPYDEKPFVTMLRAQLVRMDPYYTSSAVEVPYPSGAEAVDLCLGDPDTWDWALELKYARMKRSNGRLEEAAISRVLSPYQESALIDCQKVLRFNAAQFRAVVLVGYDYADIRLAPLVSDFETLARKRVTLTDVASAEFTASPTAERHSIHSRGSILAWRIEPLTQ
jgi:hypothetical protein